MLRARRRMVGLIGVFLALSVGLVLVGCSSDAPPEDQQAQFTVTSQSASEQAQDQPQAEPQTEQTEQDQPQAEQSTDAEAAAEAQSDDQQQAVQEQSSEQESDAAEPQMSQQDETQQDDAQPAEEQQTAAAADESEPSIEQSLAGVRGIVDPTNTGWPREVEGFNGVFSIPAKPMRIITASIGHDEIVLALVPQERLIAVGAVSKDATFSNIADLVLDKAEVSRDPETIIVQSPDIVVTSPYYPVEGIDALRRAGILVIQTELELDPQSHINNVKLIGYILGEEERAIAFADEVQSRFQTVLDATADKSDRPNVISLTQYGDSLWTAGSGSTQGSLIEAAGGVNAAATAGIEGNQTIGLEAVIVMAPDVIIIPQPAAYGAEEFRQSLFDNAALAEIPAIGSGSVYVVDSKLFTTLSHWNVRGAEQLARILWPDDFPDPPAESFSLVE